MFNTYNFYVCLSSTDIKDFKLLLENTETTLGEKLMSTKDEVLAAVADEKVEVAVAIAELNAKIDELIANGTGVTGADLDEIKAAIQGIFMVPVVE